MAAPLSFELLQAIPEPDECPSSGDDPVTGRAYRWVMLSYHEIREVVERALEQHGPNESALAGAVATLVPPDCREAYTDVLDVP